MLEELILQIFDWIDVLSPLWIYVIITLVAYVENILPPIPGDLVVAFAGYLAASGTISFFIIYAATTIASVAGFMSVYIVGSYFGAQINEQPSRVRILRFIKFSHYAKVKAWMQRWGQGVIIANRFLPGMRSVISVTAGVSHTQTGLTVLSSTISSLLWNFVLIGSGWVLYENWRKIEDYLSLYSKSVLALLLVLILTVIGYKYWQKRR